MGGAGAASEVRLTPETTEQIRDMVAEGVRKGIADALNEQTAEQFWAAGLAVLQKRASEHTGRFILGGLWGLARKASLFLMLGGFVYAIGGWQALAEFFKAIMGRV